MIDDEAMEDYRSRFDAEISPVLEQLSKVRLAYFRRPPPSSTRRCRSAAGHARIFETPASRARSVDGTSATLRPWRSAERSICAVAANPFSEGRHAR